MCWLGETTVVHAWIHPRYHAPSHLPHSSEGDSLAVQHGEVLLLLLELQTDQSVANESGLGPRARCSATIHMLVEVEELRR